MPHRILRHVRRDWHDSEKSWGILAKIGPASVSKRFGVIDTEQILLQRAAAFMDLDR